MIVSRLMIQNLEKEYGVSLQVPESVCIINTETGNDQFIDGEWRPDKGFVTTIGFLRDMRIMVLTRSMPNDPAFDLEVKFWFDMLQAQKYSLWAFNSTTEAGNLFAMFGMNYEINDLKPKFPVKRDEILALLTNAGIIPELKKPIFQAIGKGTINAWQKFLENGDEENLHLLIDHNMGALLKEALLFNHKDAALRLLSSRKPDIDAHRNAARGISDAKA